MFKSKFSLEFLRYLFSGISKRFSDQRCCPDCASSAAKVIDRKGFHEFVECVNCRLCYRFPTESAEEMAAYYQTTYGDGSIATELPNETELAHLLSQGAADTAYDRRFQLRVYGQLGAQPGKRVLDFGASWGYFVLQLQQSGIKAQGFEISKPRAEFATRLGVSVLNDENALAKPFDVICSTHVIEHVPRPLEKLAQMLSWLKPGGTVIASTPNATAAYRAQDRTNFHRSWGLVHPVLLSSDAVAKRFPNEAVLLTTDDSAENLASWDGRSRKIDPCDGAGLLIAIRKP